MEKGELQDWVWQDDGKNEKPLLKAIDRLAPLYEANPPPVCYPGTPLDLDPEIMKRIPRLMRMHLNAIGTHTHGRDGEGGFEDLQKKEAQTIWMLASVLGGTPQTVDGFFCGGATEANLQGLWIGREWLRHRPDPARRGVAVLATPLVHYSIIKAAEILDLGHPQWAHCPRCGNSHLFLPDALGCGVNVVGMNERGEMLMRDLERVFHLRYEEGFRRFMIVPTLGTSALGSIDPIKDICVFVDRIHRSTSANVYIHVDAAFGGFTEPFVNPQSDVGFQNPAIMSMALDADKMGHLPYPAGVFLCRKELQALVARRVNYVRGQEDDTVPGSRSALAPLLGWYWFQKIGKNGQKIFVEQCLQARNRLAGRLQERFGNSHVAPTVRMLPFSPWVNFLPLEIDLPGENVPAKFAPYHLRHDFFPRDPENVLSCPRTVYKICIMPHTFRTLDRFADDLDQAVKVASAAAVK